MIRRRIVLPLALFAGLCGCQHAPTITYPQLVPAGEREAALDCDQLLHELRKSDAVRWVMRSDGARLIAAGERRARQATSAVMVAAGVMTGMPIGVLGDEGSVALDRADRRIVSLLDLRAGKGCEARATALENMDEHAVRSSLQELLQGQAAAGNRDKMQSLFAERTRLLDGLWPAEGAAR